MGIVFPAMVLSGEDWKKQSREGAGVKGFLRHNGLGRIVVAFPEVLHLDSRHAFSLASMSIFSFLASSS